MDIVFAVRGKRGLVTPVDSAAGSLPRAALTAAGTDRFEQLRQLALGMTAAQSIAACRWVDSHGASRSRSAG